LNSNRGMVRKQKILIVDDDRQLNQLLQTALSLAGYEVLSAYEGESGLNLLNSHPDVDLLLLDIMMPKMDGLTVLEKIGDERKGQQRVIVMTSLSQEVVADKLNDYQILGVLDKTQLLPKEIVEKVKEWLKDTKA
jgi:CheY-like chemotaxis protein